MNKRIKKLWIKALRSGEFKQCKGHLEKDGKYCALGVLSLIAMSEGICTYNVEKGVGKFDNKRFSLSFNVMKWAEIAQDSDRFLNQVEQEVVVKIGDLITTISRLNDQGKSFKQIANIIEKS